MTSSLPAKTVKYQDEMVVMRRRPVKTALHQAVWDGRTHQAKLLLDIVTDCDYQDANGWTPLMLACSLEQELVAIKMMRMFLKQGADINIQDKRGRTALMIACLSEKPALISKLLNDDRLDLLADDNDGNTALIHAAIECSPQTVQAILEKMVNLGLTVDTRNKNGYTALLLACKNGKYKNALHLIKLGHASPYLRDYNHNLTAKEWLSRSRFQLQRQCQKERKQTFPQLLAARKTIPLTSQSTINKLLNSTYKPLLKEPERYLRRWHTVIPITDKDNKHKFPQNIAANTQSSNSEVEELQRAITQVGETQSAKRKRLRREKSVQVTTRRSRRDVNTAILRSVGPKHEKIIPLEHLFELYSLECLNQSKSVAE